MPPTPRSRRAARLIAVPVALASFGLAAAACGGSTTTTSSPSTTAASSGSSTTAASSGGTTAPATKKVSANTASKAELEAALTAAGVQNAAKWANEIEEYRPYPTDDPTLASLRKNLAKYKPSAEQLDKILSVLEP